MEMGRSWQELGVVDTIYEDEEEEEEEEEETEDCFNSPTMSSSAPSSASCSPAAAHSTASLPPVLRTAAREWYVRFSSVQFSSSWTKTERINSTSLN
jgi:hypothetical protein